MKTYSITTDDDKQLARAVQADSLALVLMDMDSELRAIAKWSEDEKAQKCAEDWREKLHDLAAGYGVVIGDLLE